VNTHSISNILTNSIVCNLALGFEPEIRHENRFQIIEQYRNNFHTLVALHVASDVTNFETSMKNIAAIHDFIHKNSTQFALFEKVEDIELAKKHNKTLLTFVFQGTFPIQRNLDYINLFNKVGVKTMILAYNVANDVGGGCSEGNNDCGLTEFGKQVIKRMNQTNTIIDLSHCGIKTSMEAI
jgi:membrane dipeptidase